MERTELKPETGGIYRHFKDGLCQVIAVATQVETNDRVVVYQSMSGGYPVYVQRLEHFMEEVDKKRYPQCGQRMCFEKVDRESLSRGDMQGEQQPAGGDPETDGKAQVKAYEPGVHINPDLLRFLDADSSNAKLKVLSDIRERIDTRMLNSIEASMDIVGDGGSLDSRIDYIASQLRVRSRYEDNRLR